MNSIPFKIVSVTIISDFFGKMSLASTSSGQQVILPWSVIWKNLLKDIDTFKVQVPMMLMYMVDIKFHLTFIMNQPASQHLNLDHNFLKQYEDSVWLLVTAIYKHILATNSKEILSNFKSHMPSLLSKNTPEVHSILEVCIHSFGIDFLGGLDQDPADLNYDSVPAFPKALEEYCSRNMISSLEPDSVKKIVKILEDNPLKGPQTTKILNGIQKVFVNHADLMIKLDALASKRLSTSKTDNDPVALYSQAGKEFQHFLKSKPCNCLEYQIRLDKLVKDSQYHVDDRLSTLWLSPEQLNIPPSHEFNLQPATTISGSPPNPKKAPARGEVLCKHPLLDVIALKSTLCNNLRFFKFVIFCKVPFSHIHF